MITAKNKTEFGGNSREKKEMEKNKKKNTREETRYFNLLAPFFFF